jgi:hypothetical protein
VILCHYSGISDSLPPKDTLCTDVMVAQLVQAKLPDDIVAQKIEECDPHFQLDPAHLIALKQAGVSDELIRTMARRQSGGAVRTSPQSPFSPASSPSGLSEGLPGEVGVYWIHPGGELYRIEGIAVSNTRTGSTFASKMTFHIKRARINAQLKGARAELRVNVHQPQFFICLPEGASIGDYIMVHMAKREDVRQIEIAEETFWKSQTGIDHYQQVDFSYQRVGDHVYAVTPKSEISSGEFGFYVASGPELTKPTGHIYDFGID